MKDVLSHELKLGMEVGNRVGKSVSETTKGLPNVGNPLKLFGVPKGI